jgi:putative PIN family toxin of toxin-antitoxin system
VGDVRLVMDTDAVVAAMRSPAGASAAIIRAVRQRQATLLLSVPLALEYEAVCRRSEHREESGLSVRQVEIFLDAIIAMGQPVRTHFLWRPQLRNPNDEMVLEAAVNGRADALVTFNARDYGTTPAQFGVEVLLPREAIARIKR